LILNSLKETLEREQLRAHRDDLTGLYNRRAFVELGKAELARARRYNHPMAVAFIDVDDFKLINDHFGHEVGDELLKTVGRTLSHSLRSTDLIARLGGDEFIVL